MEDENGISKKELDKQYKEFVKKLAEENPIKPKKHSRFTEWLIKILS